MKTAVTGGTGFIGSHLVKSLLEQNREVIVASDLSQLGRENLSSLGVKTVDVELRQTDLSDYQQALKALTGADCVFHLAARVGSLEYLHATGMVELVTLQTNLLIDANVFRACLETGIRKIIYASSCAVYPMDTQFSAGAVFSESSLELETLDFLKPGMPDSGNRTINPDGGYGWAKLMGEVQLEWMKGVDIGIARIFNIYGENEPLGEKAHVIADLICKAILYPQEEFVVRGDGKQSRDFLYVSDCVDALLQLEKRASSPPVIVNIGSGKPTSIATIAEKATGLSGKDIKLRYDPTKPMGPISRTADITRTKALLGWQPGISLDEGLSRTYRWVQRRLGENAA
jgi:GDP-D-mannose 3',5'-epimerase